MDGFPVNDMPPDRLACRDLCAEDALRESVGNVSQRSSGDVSRSCSSDASPAAADDVSYTAGVGRRVAGRSPGDTSLPGPNDAAAGALALPESSDVITELSLLPSTALVSERALARIFRVTDRTIRNMVSRGELPAPVDLAGRSTWTAGRIIAHIETLMERAARDNAQRWGGRKAI